MFSEQSWQTPLCKIQWGIVSRWRLAVCLIAAEKQRWSRQARNLNKIHPSKICPCDWLSHQVLKFNSPFTINSITISFFQTHPILWKFGPLNYLLITSAIVLFYLIPTITQETLAHLIDGKKATFREMCLRSYCSNRPRMQISFNIKVRWLKKLKNILQKIMKLITLER